MSTNSDLIKIICECCGAKIEVDPQTRRIFSTEKEGMKKRSFDEVVKDVTSVAARAEEKLQRNIEKERTRKADLDRLFEEAKKKAEQEPNVRPKSIFDFD